MFEVGRILLVSIVGVVLSVIFMVLKVFNIYIYIYRLWCVSLFTSQRPILYILKFLGYLLIC